MKYLAGATLFGTIGWLFGQSVLERTGSDVLAALIFGLTVAAMVWGFDLRRQLDE
jgi:hypothetical protein